jgi:hypothetical protein
VEPNNALSLQIKGILQEHLGQYSDGRTAWWPVESSGALLAEGLPGGVSVTGLEAIFSLYPLDYRQVMKFGVGFDPDVLYHMLVLKAWSGPITPARFAIEAAFPLMQTRLKQRERYTPAVSLGDGVTSVEQLTLMVPVEAT